MFPDPTDSLQHTRFALIVSSSRPSSMSSPLPYVYHSLRRYRSQPPSGDFAKKEPRQHISKEPNITPPSEEKNNWTLDSRKQKWDPVPNHHPP